MWIFRRREGAARQTLSPGDRADPGLASVRGLDWRGPNRRREGCTMSIKLTDTQLVLLGAAAQRKDLCLVAPPTLNGATARKVASKLISAGFVKEVKAKASDPVWRRDQDQERPMRSSSPPRAPKRSRSMTPPSLRMQARQAPRSGTMIRQLSCLSWTPRTLDPPKRWSLVLQARLLPRRLEAGSCYCAARVRSWRDHCGIDRCDGLARHDPRRADRPAQARLCSRD